MSKIISPDKIQLELNKLAKASKTLSVNDLRMILALERVIAHSITNQSVNRGGLVANYSSLGLGPAGCRILAA